KGERVQAGLSYFMGKVPCLDDVADAAKAAKAAKKGATAKAAKAADAAADLAKKPTNKATKEIMSGPPSASGPTKDAAKAARRAPAPDNYRGRYNADRHENGLPRLPDDYDAHHRIPQEYREHPEFKDFDFDAPKNIQGVKGSRSDENIHQDITNAWAVF